MGEKIEIDKEERERIAKVLQTLVEDNNYLRQKCYDLIWENIKLKIEYGVK